MKHPILGELSGSSQTDTDEQIVEAVREAIKNLDDKVIEIRPANGSSGRGTLSLLLLVGSVLAVGYWLRQSQRPTDMLRSTANEVADRTEEVTDRTAETIQEGGETVAERVEEESQKAGEQVQQTGESTAEAAEQAVEEAAEDEDGSERSSFDSSSSD